MLLQERIAIITGSARGIGKGIALKFAEHGCVPVVVDVLEEEGGKTVQELARDGKDALFMRCDVSDSGDVRKVVEDVVQKFGKIDILVNNAGTPGGMPRSIVEIPEQEWDRVLGINLKGAYLFCKAVVPYMKQKKYGRIINISSMAAIAPPAPLIHYSSSKAGMLGLTLDLALELAPFQITVNAVIPGAIRTDIWDHLIPPGMDKEAFFAEVVKGVAPMGRIGTPEDIAGAALFYASELSSYVSGDRIIVAGGGPLSARIKA